MKIDFSNLRGDIYGGITAGVVALPLALALGVASGAGAIAGLYGAIAVGFFASLFGGTGPQISGPTGPMVVVFAGLFAGFAGQPDMVFTAVILAGLMQVAFGFMGFGQYIRLVPYPVISGFMSGIGCIIIILQVARLLGHEPPGGTLGALAEIPTAISAPHWNALLVGAVTLGTVFAWPSRFGRLLPAPLAALMIGTAVSLFLPGVPVLGTIPTGLPELHLPVYEASAVPLIIEAAFILALLGAIDSLLTSLVADNMTRTRHHSNRELVGQGIGNTLAGLIGGVPGAGATMRTVVNIRAGGRTPLSGMTHGVLLLAIVLGLGSYASQIPHAALAGILVKVGYDIIDWTYLRKAHRGPRWDLLLMALVLGMTVFVDLISAVATGVVLAALTFVKQVADHQLQTIGVRQPDDESAEETYILDKADGRISLFDFGGPLSFGAVADLGHQVREHSRDGTDAIVLDFSRVAFMDVSAARAVETIASDAHKAEKQIYVTGMNKQVSTILAGLEADHCIPADHRFTSRIDALRHAMAHLGMRDGLRDAQVEAAE